MQDIGGCRAIVASADDAFTLAADLGASRMRHELVRYQNYTDNPRATGYRGLHLIYAYYSDRTTNWQGLQIEIQIRSQLQHQWATAVETVGTFIGDALKSNVGDTTWLRFFALMSSVFALREGAPLVPNTPSEESEIVEELRLCNEALQISERISAFEGVTAQVEALRDRRVRIAVLELNLVTQLVRGYGYLSTELEEAAEAYRHLEERSREDPNVDVVLVSTDSLNALRQAYPNYFADIREFRNVVRETIEGS